VIWSNKNITNVKVKVFITMDRNKLEIKVLIETNIWVKALASLVVGYKGWQMPLQYCNVFIT
jgi:hypothetical protein